MKYLFTLALMLSCFLGMSQIDTIPKEKEEEETLTFTEQMPSYPGGEEAMMKFISKNLKYPKAAMEAGIQGRVVLRFTVSKTGKIVDIHSINKKKLGYGLEEAAIDVIAAMPDWQPGTQRGTPVSVYFTIPISFKLN
ncbi:MAG: energy transducer TonB [Flavobacteriales bacterium]|nr:energy transducer TonB [Flavobacteriales bacterium]